MTVLLQSFDPEGKPEDPFEYLFRGLTVEKLGKKSGDVMKVGGEPCVIIEVKMGETDDFFTEPVDTLVVKKVANQ